MSTCGCCEYALKNRETCEDKSVGYLIKRNLRRKNPLDYLTYAKENNIKPKPLREGKVQYDFFTVENGYRSANRITVRSIDSDGTILLIEEVEVEKM